MNLKRRILYTLAHLMAFLPDTWTLRIQYLIRTPSASPKSCSTTKPTTATPS